MPNIKYADSSVQVNVMLEPSLSESDLIVRLIVWKMMFCCLQSLPWVDLAEARDGMVLVLTFIISANTRQQGL